MESNGLVFTRAERSTKTKGTFFALFFGSISQNTQGEFTLENFAGAFCVLAAGLVIACFVAVMEIWAFIRKGNTYPPLTHNEPGDQKNIVKADMFIQV